MMSAKPYMLMMSNSSAVIWVIRVWGEGAIASRTKMEIDAPTTKLNPNIKKGLSGITVAIASIAIANININSSTNRGGLYWLDITKV